MAKTYYKLSVSKKTINSIRIDCVQEFLKHNPEYKEIPITDEVICSRIKEFYLKPRG